MTPTIGKKHSSKFISVQFSRSVMSNSLWPHGLQNARLPCPSSTPWDYSNSDPLSWWCHPIISSYVIRVFSNESILCIGWPKCWSFSFSISPSSEYSGLISFRIDWFNLVVQGTLWTLFQHHSLKASILQCSVTVVNVCIIKCLHSRC